MNETKKNNGEIEIDLWKLVQVYLRSWWIIMLCALIAAAGTLFYTANYITPMYRASVTIYVNNTSNQEKTTEYVSGGDLSTSKMLVATYTNMLTSDTVLERVIKESGVTNYTAASLRGLVSASQVGDTEIFKVYVSNADPGIAAQLANAIAKTAPDVIAEFVEGSSTKIIDYAKRPTGRYTPDYTRNTVIGAAVGAAAALVFLTLQSLLDVRIKDENDLADLFDLPILGQIPDLEQNGGRHTYGKTYAYEQAAKKAEGKQEEQKK